MKALDQSWHVSCFVCKVEHTFNFFRLHLLNIITLIIFDHLMIIIIIITAIIIIIFLRSVEYPLRGRKTSTVSKATPCADRAWAQKNKTSLE